MTSGALLLLLCVVLLGLGLAANFIASRALAASAHAACWRAAACSRRSRSA